MRKKQLVTLFNRQKGLCSICGRSMILKIGHDHTATVDHVIPRSKVPLEVREAFYRAHDTRRAACLKCNREKGDRYLCEGT